VKERCASAPPVSRRLAVFPLKAVRRILGIKPRMTNKA